MVKRAKQAGHGGAHLQSHQVGSEDRRTSEFQANLGYRVEL